MDATTEQDDWYLTAMDPDGIEEAIDDAKDDPDLLIGRHGRGIVSIGLFGGHGHTDDPDAVTCAEDDARGLPIAKKAYRFIDEAVSEADFDSHVGARVRYPTVINDEPMYGRSDLDKPFTTYRFPFYIAPPENGYIGEDTLYEEIADRFERDLHDSNTRIRAVEFDRDRHTLGERFRAIYPWGKQNGRADELPEGCELPTPVKETKRVLHKHPQLPEFYPVTVYVHAYNTRYDKYDSASDEFDREFFYTSGHQYILDTDGLDEGEQALANARTKVRQPSISYTLTVDVLQEDVEEAMADDGLYGIQEPDDYARWVASEHYADEYGGNPSDATAGVSQRKEHDDKFVFTVTVTA